jgi:hypothetical protein
MNEYTLIYENAALLFFSDDDKQYYENTDAGRNAILADCTCRHRLDLYDEVMKIWGDTPTLPDPVPITLEDLKTQKKAEIAAARYDAETAGTTVNGITIDTGRDSQALITGAALAAMLDGEYSLNWKTPTGFVHLTSPEIIAVAQAVRAHVQSCFDKEGELVARINAATTKEELDAITW